MIDSYFLLFRNTLHRKYDLWITEEEYNDLCKRVNSGYETILDGNDKQAIVKCRFKNNTIYVRFDFEVKRILTATEHI